MEKMVGPSMLFYLMDLDHRSQHNKFGLRYDCKTGSVLQNFLTASFSHKFYDVTVAVVLSFYIF